jgi:hypothetical protein
MPEPLKSKAYPAASENSATDLVRSQHVIAHWHRSQARHLCDREAEISDSECQSGSREGGRLFSTPHERRIAVKRVIDFIPPIVAPKVPTAGIVAAKARTRRAFQQAA